MYIRYENKFDFSNDPKLSSKKKMLDLTLCDKVMFRADKHDNLQILEITIICGGINLLNL